VPPSPDDWFRADAWDDAAQQLFEAKLARARTSRSQYLRIKGLVLLETRDPARIEAGRVLSQRVIEEHPDDLLQTSGAHYALGDSFARESRFTEAQEHLRACLAIEASWNVKHNTELRLAEVLIDAGSPAGLVEAWELLDVAAGQRSPFQVIAWRIEVARARVRDRQSDRAGAAGHARAALDLLARNESRFPRHPGVGVIEPDRDTLRELRALASA
jgi:hypothetical protein